MLESCTFGGVLRLEREQEQIAKSHYTINGKDGVPGVWFAYSDYPGRDIWAMTGNTDSNDNGQLHQKHRGPFYHREWQVSFSWLLKLLTDSFWDDDVPKDGQKALTPPMDVGYVMRRDAERKYGPLHSGEIRPGVVPDGYGMLPRSYVMVKNCLFSEGRGAMMFPDFGLGRMALFSPDDKMEVGDDEEYFAGSDDNGPGNIEPVRWEAVFGSD